MTTLEADPAPPSSPGASASRWGRHPRWLAPTFVGALAFIWLSVVERTFMAANSSWLPAGFRIHDMTANNTQQTVDVAEMNSYGIRFAWYEHVYPPLLDLIRYVLMLPEVRAGLEPSGDAVDDRLYWLFGVFFGVVVAIVYLWVRDLTGSGWWALGASVLWAVSPISVTVMTLLEPTPLSMTLVTLTFYLLYRFLKTRSMGYSTAFFGALLVASLSRNVVQLHVMAILAVAVVAFWIMARNRRKVLLVVNLILVLLTFFWPVRAFVMYGTWDVSTHTGYHRAGALWIDPRTAPEPSYPFHISDNALSFTSRFNTQPLVAENYKLGLAANELMLSDPVEAGSRLARSLTITIPNALLPITATTDNYLVEQFWWSAPYEWLFSGWSYVLLLLGSAVIIIWARGWPGSLRLLRRYGWFAVFWILVAIPVAFSNRYWPPGSEDLGPIHTEAARLKAFLEVPLYAVAFYAAWLLVGRVRGWLVKQRESAASNAA